MKKKRALFWIILMVVNPLVSLAFAIWVFSIPGTWGMVKWDAYFRMVTVLVLSLGFWAPVILGIRWLLLRRWKGIFGLVRWLERGLSVLTLVVSLGVLGFLAVQPLIREGDKGPLLLAATPAGQPGETQLVLSLWSKEKSQLSVSLEGSSGAQTLGDAAKTRVHRFAFPELEPFTTYSYRLGNESPVLFRTPPDISRGSTQTLNVAFSSDAHFGAGNNSPEDTSGIWNNWLTRAADPGSENRLDLVCSLGDLVEMGFSDDEWQQALDVLAPLQRSGSFVQVPLMSAPGNHDVAFGGYLNYLDYFSPLTNPSRKDMYRRVDVGPVHFLLLSNLWGMEDFSRAQMDWLQAQLGSIPEEDWTVVVSHCFYYASGIAIGNIHWYDHRENIEKLVPVFEQGGVDIVVSGHNHQMELLEKQGITYALVGTFGGVLEKDPQVISSASQWYANQTHGWLEIRFSPQQAQLVFFDVQGKELFSQEVSQ